MLFNELPEDIIYIIFGYLPIARIVLCRKVCRRFYRVLWHRAFLLNAYHDFWDDQCLTVPPFDLSQLTADEVGNELIRAERLDYNLNLPEPQPVRCATHQYPFAFHICLVNFELLFSLVDGGTLACFHFNANGDLTQLWKDNIQSGSHSCQPGGSYTENGSEIFTILVYRRLYYFQMPEPGSIGRTESTQQVQLLRIHELNFVLGASEVVQGDEWISSSNHSFDTWLFNCRSLVVYKLERPPVTTGSLLGCKPFFGGANLLLCSWSFEGSNIIAVYPLPLSHQRSCSPSNDSPERIIRISAYASIPEMLGLATLIYKHSTGKHEGPTSRDIGDSIETLGHIATSSRLLTFTVLIQNGPMSLKLGIMNLYLPPTLHLTVSVDNPSLLEIPKFYATLVLGSPSIDRSLGRCNLYQVVGKTLFASTGDGDPIPENDYLMNLPLWVHRLKVPNLLRQAELARRTEVEMRQLPKDLHPSGNLWTGLQHFIGTRKVILDFTFDEQSGRLYVLTCGKPGFQLHVADYV